MTHSAFSNTLDPELVKCRERAIDLLQNEYPVVKDGMLALEVFMRRRSRKAVYELRDFLSHFAKIFEPDVAVEDAKHNLAECRTHLRRATVEPLEYRAEKTFVRLDRLERYFGCVLWRAPQTRKAFYKTMVGIKKNIAAGRQVKAEGKATEFFRQAFEDAQDLKAEVRPALYILRAIIFIIAVFLTGFLTRAGTAFFDKCATPSVSDAGEREQAATNAPDTTKEAPSEAETP